MNSSSSLSERSRRLSRLRELGAKAPTLAQVKAERARRQADRARASLSEFIRQGWHVLEPTTPLEWNWHHDALCEHLQALLSDWMAKQRDPAFVQRFQNFLANVPPGSMKSRIVSVYMPAWMWLHWPSWRALFLSSNPRVALRDSVFCRDVLRSRWYRDTFRPAWDFAEDQDAKGLYRNTEGGFRQAQGFTAKVTGDRFDAIIWDDPHDADDVHSEAQRTAVVERWDSAVANRLNDLRSSVRIGIMQRLHESDLSGHVLAQGGWEHLCLPMEFEARRACECATCERGETSIGWRDPRTVDGEVMHPQRFTLDVLAAEKARGSYYFAGQFQQRPAPTTSALFPRRWWRFWREPGTDPSPRPRGCDTEAPAVFLPASFDAVIQSWDCTFKDSDGSDYVCGGVWGAKGADRFLLYRVWARLDFTSTVREVRRVSELFPGAGAKLIEDKANGPAVIATLKSEIAGVIPVEPNGSKTARAMAIQPQVEAGNVYLPEAADWLDVYVGEFESFPRAAHDDQVDMTSQALLRLASKPSPADRYKKAQW